MEEKNKDTFVKKAFANGIGIYISLMIIAFLINRFLNFAWTYYATIAIVAMYLIVALISIYNSKTQPIFKLKKIELVFFQVIIPVSISVVVGITCSLVTRDSEKGFWENIQIWATNKDNQFFLIIVFSVLVILCYFIAYERAEIVKAGKEGCRFDGKMIELYNNKMIELYNNNKSDETYERVKAIQSILERKSQVAYTATCIPIRYNKDHDSFVFALIKNISHDESQWMFPGSHVDVSNNQLAEDFELNDIDVVPGCIIEKKVKKEAGLLDLQFIDPYYETVGFEDDVNGKQQRSYPNTCYPAKTPVFNYLFRVSESARCYKNQNLYLILLR